jgi:hypothetical protein
MKQRYSISSLNIRGAPGAMYGDNIPTKSNFDGLEEKVKALFRKSSWERWKTSSRNI